MQEDESGVNDPESRSGRRRRRRRRRRGSRMEQRPQLEAV